MKAAVIGNGNVGMAVFRELQKLREVNELVLVGRNQEKLQAELMDFRDAQVLSPTATYGKVSCGGYDTTEGADIIIYAAGVGRKPGQSRLELAGANVSIASDIFREVMKVNHDAIIVVLSNPVDVLTAVIREVTGFPRERVIGSGTLLDTARLVAEISSILDISPSSINGLMLGEHGNSSCVIWSAVRIIGMPLNDYFAFETGSDMGISKDKLSSFVRAVGGKIIGAKGYTAYGVAAAAAKIVSGIANNTKDIYPLSIQLDGELDYKRVAVSVPCLLGREGIIRIVPIHMTPEEWDGFHKSVAVVREITDPILESL